MLAGTVELSAPLTGWLCDRAIARGAAPERVLKGTMNAALLAVAIAMAACRRSVSTAAISGPRPSVWSSPTATRARG